MKTCAECGEAIKSPDQQCWETGGTCIPDEDEARHTVGPHRGTVTYKGRKYKLLWKGKTKFGERAHLSFIDGTKDFWVAAGKLE